MATQVEILRQRSSDAWDAYAAEMAKYGDDNLPTDGQAEHIGELRLAATDATKAMNAAEQFMRDQSAFEQQDTMIRSSRVRPPLGGGEPRQAADRRTIGQRFAEMPGYQDWLKAIAPNGVIPDSAKGLHSPPMLFGGLRELEQRASLITGDSATSGGAFVLPSQYPSTVELGRRPLTLRQVITNLQTDSDTVEFVRITTETNAAAPVAEATAASGSSGVKPESDLAFERVTATVKTIAHWIPATKRALSDASQLRGLIDAFLRYGLEEELEDQIANGSGVGENFTGLLNTSNTQAQAWDTDLFKTLRVAKRKVSTVGRRIPNAFVLNPEDWERAELSQDDNYRYYGNGPFANTQPTIWGLPVVVSEAMTAGTGMVGDFSMAVLWDREQASISISDSHSDFFIRNLVAILAELRAAFGVLKPNAFVEIDLTA